ncbi:MAG: Ig-like domain-containing protein [Prevotellaceae bacterium]|jgi:hypothetical protein|nr:Ig-like domain-containing protein [Prevotellaceae bacterium]
MTKKLSLIAVIALLIISCTDDIVSIVIDKITFDQNELKLTVGEKKTLTATILPEDATNKTLTWSSNDKSVADVNDSGVVTGTGAGTTTIFVTSANKVQASCIVIVEPIAVDVLATGITLNKPSLTLSIGETETLTATIIPDNTTNNTLTWSSDNENVADVNNAGVVTAIATGTATVTVTTVNNIKATCLIIVGEEQNVYVAGYAWNADNKTIAKVWKNGEDLYSLTTGSNSAEAHSVYFANDNVYVAGFEGNVAKLWINTVAQSLSDGTKLAEAKSVFVSDADVYVAGYERNENLKTVAKVWKNGNPIPITDGTKDAQANSVFVLGSDVYVAGYEANESGIIMAKYWKNGVSYSLGGNFDVTNATSIYVSGSDVHVAGYKISNNKHTAILWTNGTAKNLTNGSRNASAYSVYVAKNNDVYVAGNEANSNGYYTIAKIWKNGALLEELTDGTQWAYANSIVVTENNIYVAGQETNTNNKSVAKIWKDGEEQTLTDGTKDARAMSIFVK